MNPLLVSNVLLWVLVVVLALVVLALVRQVGVLHERITPVGALMLAKGLKVGEIAPTLPLHTLEGGSVTVGGTRTDKRSQLVMFVSPTCPVCKALLPVLKSSRRSEAEWLEVVLASDGEHASRGAYAVLCNGAPSNPNLMGHDTMPAHRSKLASVL